MNIAEAAVWLQHCDNVVILIHRTPDGDCIGGGFALAAMLQQMGKHAVVRCSDPIPERYAFLVDETACWQEGIQEDCILSVDIADTKLMGSLQEIYGDCVQLAIDHHVSHQQFARHLCLYPHAAAACEVLYDLAKQLSITITPQIATCLYTGIATDSGCFQYDNVTSHTLRCVADLMEQCPTVPYAQINRAMFVVKSFGRMQLERVLIENMQLLLNGKCAVICITQAFLQTYGVDFSEVDGMANLPLQVEGVEVGITMKEKELGAFHISMRSADAIDVSCICKQFGGGGHVKAAGCRILGTEEVVREQLISAVERSLAEK